MMFVMDMCTKLLRKNANQENLINQYQLQGITRQLCLNTLIHGLYQLQRVIINYDILCPFYWLFFNHNKEQLKSDYTTFQSRRPVMKQMLVVVWMLTTRLRQKIAVRTETHVQKEKVDARTIVIVREIQYAAIKIVILHMDLMQVTKNLFYTFQKILFLVETIIRRRINTFH